MSINFTPDEKRYIAYFTRLDKPIYRWGFYSAWLVPILAFGSYGLLRQDIVALGMAFFGLLFFTLWRIASSFRSQRIVASILDKVADEKSSPAAPRE
ncbi:hypothetical protein [Dyella mobilis]|uniref:Uncharacterized protein n=1 Tax=Dyella mobilis TaxID=1849582 RepID=A0ABS2KFE0_9GAMM|nr:hypothetical protein [Dyella mobilis]MBM7129857.1 hypothetical protein [Dyella mobilis]GLQ97878.1 hypothetical protein GCM10007863_22980 [Dyella mobilis]